jgi:hypothetical protein
VARAVAAGKALAVRRVRGLGQGYGFEDVLTDPAGTDYSESYTPGEQSATWAAIDRLKAAGADFAAKYQTFMAAGDEIVEAQPGGNWLAEWGAIRQNADYVRSIIQGVADTVDGVTGWGRKVFGLDGMKALPLIPITYAAVAGAVAIVLASANSMYQFTVNWNRAKAGLAPVVGGTSLLSEGSNLVKWLIAAGVLYYAAPEIMRVLKGRQ